MGDKQGLISSLRQLLKKFWRPEHCLPSQQEHQLLRNSGSSSNKVGGFESRRFHHCKEIRTTLAFLTFNQRMH